MEKLKGYRMPIFEDDSIIEKESTKEKQSRLQSFYLAVLSCNVITHTCM